jgi:hypothetical protein
MTCRLTSTIVEMVETGRSRRFMTGFSIQNFARIMTHAISRHVAPALLTYYPYLCHRRQRYLEVHIHNPVQCHSGGQCCMRLLRSFCHHSWVEPEEHTKCSGERSETKARAAGEKTPWCLH